MKMLQIPAKDKALKESMQKRGVPTLDREWPGKALVQQGRIPEVADDRVAL
jgi:hypothetical protein